MNLPDTIVCVDCGQPARLMTAEPEFGWECGDIVAYRCTGCHDRWDVVIGDEDSDQPSETSLMVRQWFLDREDQKG